VDATAIEPRRNARRSAPPLVMPAIETGWDAIFLQVSPPSPTRAPSA
jgi:hypothetical protein